MKRQRTYLPYSDADLPPEGQTVNPLLSEWRALRDSYGQKASVALAQRFGTRAGTWDRLIDRCKAFPLSESAGFEVLASVICDISQWAAVTRFVWLCDRVWNLELMDLAKSQCGWARDESSNKAAKGLL